MYMHVSIFDSKFTKFTQTAVHMIMYHLSLPHTTHILASYLN